MHSHVGATHRERDAMNSETLIRELRENVVVALDASEWASMEGHFEAIEVHDTCLAGELRIIATGAGLVSVEQPDLGRRVVRLLGDESAVRHFVAERLDTYDRMWDGCGCRIDYFK